MGHPNMSLKVMRFGRRFWRRPSALLSLRNVRMA